MSSSKPKSGAPETPKSKAVPGLTPSPGPRPSKVPVRGAADSSSSPSPKPPRVSLDRSKPSPKVSPSSTSPLSLKQGSRTLKGSGQQSQLSLLQDELNKAKEQIALVEKEKAKALEELKEAREVADGVNEKLKDALVAQKRAEDDSNIEKFRNVELEQAGIEATRKKEEEWQKDLEAARNQHAEDVAALRSAVGELQQVQHELALAVDAKAQALIHADDVARITDTHAKENQALSGEILRLRDALDSKLEREADENNRMVLQLKEEVGVLSRELERYKGIEGKLTERDVAVERLNVDLEAAKQAEAYACSLVKEWESRAEGLEKSLEEANRLERSASESLSSVMKQLEGSNDLLHDAEAEIYALKEKVTSLETKAERRMRELEEAGRRLTEVKQELEDAEKAADSLRSNLSALEEEKDRALCSEQVASSRVQALLEEKARLVEELRVSKEEEERSKRAMESLASALHEVSAEARDAKEKLVCIQIEHENCEAQLEDLRLVRKATIEKYEAMLHDAKCEMDGLASALEQSKYEYETSKEEWEQKELHLVDCLKRSEQEKHDLEGGKEGLEVLLGQATEKAAGAERREALLRDRLKGAEDEVLYLQGALGEAKDESMKLKESVLDKEDELRGSAREIEELQAREASSLQRIEELSKLLEEATLKVEQAENGNLSDCEEDYDLLPKVVNFSEDNAANAVGEKALLQPERPPKRIGASSADEPGEVDKVNGKSKSQEREGEEEEEKGGEPEYKMWESCKIEKQELSTGEEPEQEAAEDSEELDTKKAREGESEGILEQEENWMNSSEQGFEEGEGSPNGKQNPKKKKPLLRKFGSLLKKKKGTTSPKREEI